tara:strand:- start:40 stop:447 length:408 start_codon:yes stop_codon:yes gene_type:complete
MGKNKDWNTPLTPEELKEIQKRLKGKGGSPGDVWKKIQASNRQPLMIASHSKDGFQYYDEYGRAVPKADYELPNPSGEPIEVQWLKKEYYKDHERRKQLHLDRWHNREQLSSRPTGKNKLLKRGWAKRLLNKGYA